MLRVVLEQAEPGNGSAQRATGGAGESGNAITRAIEGTKQGLQDATGKSRVAAAALAGNDDGFGSAGGRRRNGKGVHCGVSRSEVLAVCHDFPRLKRTGACGFCGQRCGAIRATYLIRIL